MTRVRLQSLPEPPKDYSPEQGEAWYHEQGHTFIIGLDEAGRGPLAGPVVAAAVLLENPISGLHDSKQLSERKRLALYPEICNQGALWAIAKASPQEIDAVNILQASFWAMRRALYALGWNIWEAGGNPGSTGILAAGGNRAILSPEECAQSILLVDGNHALRGIPATCQRPLVKGDGRVACIGAASILAKVCRDEIMMELAKEYPQYGFAQHRGYPSPSHLDTLANHGPCPEHRKSFKPLNKAQTNLFGQ